MSGSPQTTEDNSKRASAHPSHPSVEFQQADLHTKEILTAEQVAQILQVHQFTVLKFIKQGKLKASKLGRVYRIRRQDVNQFLDDQLENRPTKKNVIKEATEEFEESIPEKKKSKELSPVIKSETKTKRVSPETHPTPKKTVEQSEKNHKPLPPTDHYILNLHKQA